MKIKLLKGDITKIKVDAVVNAAKSSLLGGGGVDGAIHRLGGKEILEECILISNRQGGCKIGEAVITTAGNLSAKYVIHTVGPKWNKGNPKKALDKLKNCYINSLKLAKENKVKTIAFPNISTGIFRFPKKEAAQTAISTIQELSNTEIEKVIFVCYDDENYEIYKELIKKL